MDPAEADRVRLALSSQGTLIGHHQKSLQEISETLQGFSLNMSQLGARLDQFAENFNAFTTQTSAPLPSPPPPPLPAAIQTREPYIPSPSQFSGDLGSCEQFLHHCSLVFSQQPNTYATDSSKVAYIMSLCEGRAAQWATALTKTASPLCNTYVGFATEFRRIFDHPVRGREAAKRLLSLRQSSSSAAEFAVEFRILSVESGWNETALIDLFLHSLSEKLKDELATREVPSSLEEVVSLAIRLDNRLRERQRERGNHALGFSSPPSARTLRAPNPQLTSNLAGSTPSAPPPEPMQLEQTRLSPAERQRRIREGLCIYCGIAGHLIADCPKIPKDQAHQWTGRR